MNMLAQFNDVMSYIERNLMDDIEPSQISRIAGCSGIPFSQSVFLSCGDAVG